MSMKNYPRNILQGEKIEVKFLNWCPLKFVRVANEDEQKIEKWDQLWENNSGDQKRFEIKSSKKNNRSDRRASEDRTVIELKGIKNSVGWLYGKADYFAFEYEESFLVIPKLSLQSLIWTLQDMGTININPVCKTGYISSYQIYYRESQPQERCVYIPYVDLLKISLNMEQLNESK